MAEDRKAAFAAALTELLQATAALLNQTVWSPEARPLANRVAAAIVGMERLAGGGDGDDGA